LATFWSVTFLVGPGCFSVLEKEVGRQISSGLALEDSDYPVVNKVGELGLLLCLCLLLGTALAGPFLLGKLFDSSWLLFAGLLISMPSMWLQYMAEGVLAGNSRFAAYSAMPAAEGCGRLLIGALLIWSGVRTAGPLGIAIALAPAFSTIFVVRTLRSSSHRGPIVNRAHLRKSIGWLLGGILGSSVLVNVGPIIVKALADRTQQALAGRFLSGMVLVRVPLFLYNSAAATLLPSLAGHAASQNWHTFRKNLNHLLIGLGIVALTTTVGAATVGPTILTIVFGKSYTLGGPDLAALAGSASALLMATTLSVALMALRKERALCGVWAAGVLIMAATVAVIPELLARVELGLLFGSASSCALMTVIVYPYLVQQLRQPDRARGALANDRSSV